MLQKGVLKEFTIGSRKILNFVTRNSELIDRTEAICIQMDELAQKDFTYRPSLEEFERLKKTWTISLNTSGRNAPMKLRSDFSEALTKMHRESGEERLAPFLFWQYQKWHPSSSSSSTSWLAVERSLVELIKIHQSQPTVGVNSTLHTSHILVESQ